MDIVVMITMHSPDPFFLCFRENLDSSVFGVQGGRWLTTNAGDQMSLHWSKYVWTATPRTGLLE